MRKIFSLSLVFLLIGCRAVWDPTFMPAGYTYHDEEYKSPPGPEADSLGYEYSAEKNQEILQIWRIVAEDLVAQLSEQNGLPVTLYLQASKRQNAFNASFDHVLREVLRERGHTLASNPEGKAYVWYEAHLPKDVTQEDRPVYNDEAEDTYKTFEAQKEFLMMLSVAREGALAARAAGVYKLPTYGYEPEDGLEGWLNQPVMGGLRE